MWKSREVMQGTLGGSLRPCTSILHASLSQTSLVKFAHRLACPLVRCSMQNVRSNDLHHESTLRNNSLQHPVWGRREGGRVLGLGVRRELATVVAAKRNMLAELQSIREEADAGNSFTLSQFREILYCCPRFVNPVSNLCNL